MISKRLIEGWEHYRGTLGGPWECWRKDKLRNVYNVEWNQVKLPHCFNGYDCVDYDQLYYQGPGWYRTKLEVDNPYPNGRTLLHFEGAGPFTEVYVYTKKIAEHLGGYNEWTVDLTEAVEYAKSIERYHGKVPLAIMCDNSRDLESIPSDLSDFNIYGGIYRYLNLVYVPAISIERVHIATTEVNDDSARVEVKARLYNPLSLSDNTEIEVKIYDPEGKIIHSAKYSGEPWDGFKDITSFTVKNPKLWSPKCPTLYRCEVTLRSKNGDTSASERFGLRYFEFVKKGPFKLNGERLLLRGTHRHDDYPGVGAAMTEEMLREEMKSIKEMGANFIRLGHYQQSQIVLDMCDELGLLVWEEIPWCRGGLGGERYRNQARSMLRDMIDQHYNHPSIIIWGLGNENDWEGDFDYFDKNEIRAFMKELCDLAHKLDNSRKTAIRRCEFCKDIIDVYSPSIWAGWYRGPFTMYEQFTREEFEAVDCFLHAEWGADAIPGRHSENPYKNFAQDGQPATYLSVTGKVPALSDMSETYFCDVIDWHLKCQEKMDWLTGTAQWAFKDFSTPVRKENAVPYMNMKGIAQRDGKPKEAYYVFQSYWVEKPMVHIYGHGWKVRWGDEGELKTVKVYSNCPEVELYLNGQYCGKRQRNSQDFPAAGLRWDVVFQKGTNVLEAVGHSGDTEVRDRIIFEYQTEKWGEPAELIVTATPIGSERALVEAKAYDANGVFCADCAKMVRFGICGDGKLIDNLGTIGGSRVVEMVNGYASIEVELKGGRSVVSVSSDGLTTRFVEVG